MAAYPVYRFTLRSEEQLGAGQLNTIAVGLASTDDVSTFAENVENIFQANVASIDLLVSQDYSLPYPVGTGEVWRFVLRDAVGHVQTQYLYDVASGQVPQTVAAALIAAGIMLYPYGTVCTSIQVSTFLPGAYVV